MFLPKFGIYIHELIYQFTKINIFNSQGIKINSRVEVQ